MRKNHSGSSPKTLKELHNSQVFALPNSGRYNNYRLKQFPSKKIFASKKIPIIRIFLPHWHTQKFCLHHIVASALAKLEVLPAKT